MQDKDKNDIEINKLSSTKKETVCAVVVTYNRKELLLECLEALKRQIRPINAIYIIDNDSTDGTPEILLENSYIPKPPPFDLIEPWEISSSTLSTQIQTNKSQTSITIHYVRMHENTGGAGGFYEGVKRGYEKGYDWLWLMDDDAIPKTDALDKLCKTAIDIPTSRCIYSCYVEPIGKRSFSEPISILENDRTVTYLYLSEELRDQTVEGLGSPFLGLLIERRIIEKVGLPRSDTFIWGDWEYLVRIRDAGFKVYYNFGSIIYHPAHDFKLINLPLGLLKFRRPLLRPLWIPLGPSWKQYYGIRNTVYFNNRNNSILSLKTIKCLMHVFLRTIIVTYYSKEGRIKMLKNCLKGIIHGLIGNNKNAIY